MNRSTVRVLTKRVEEGLVRAHPDLMRELFSIVVNALMLAEADAVRTTATTGRGRARANHRNGYRYRDFDTRAGTVVLSIPKPRYGSYFPHWLLQFPEQAASTVMTTVATCYLFGVSTRRISALVHTVSMPSLPPARIQMVAKTIGVQFRAYRTRSLKHGPYAFVTADALALTPRKRTRDAPVRVLTAVGIGSDGRHETLGVEVCSYDAEGWSEFLRGLTARGLSGVQLVTAAAHTGLRSAMEAVLPAATWQWCHRDYLDSLQSRVPQRSWPRVDTVLRSLYEQPDATTVHAQYDRIIDALTPECPLIAVHLHAARTELLAFTTFPTQMWWQIWNSVAPVPLGPTKHVSPPRDDSAEHRPAETASLVAPAPAPAPSPALPTSPTRRSTTSGRWKNRPGSQQRDCGPERPGNTQPCNGTEIDHAEHLDVEGDIIPATNARWFHHRQSMCQWLLRHSHTLTRADSELISFAIRWAPYGGAPDYELLTTLGLGRDTVLSRIASTLIPTTTDHPQLREFKHTLRNDLLRAWAAPE
jgi:putative transposase